ncbi:MAG: VWA domain-containing protein [Candidatus Delongbacteria bacterium]|nr:VWA domain-containing protein [Candidatus Delongbacteria bacterium]
MNLEFQFPPAFALLLVIPLIIYFYYFYQTSRSSSIRYSDINRIKPLIRYSRRLKWRHSIIFLRAVVLALLITALARPRSGLQQSQIVTDGIDIVLAMDVSTSMKAVDFKPKNRLEASKMVAEEFIRGRTNDRIGLVVFAGESFTQCPLTLDYGVLISFLDRLDFGFIEDGTAIGLGLATGLNRLKTSKAKSKIIILLTDGRNNTGTIDPITAAQLAQTLGIRVYTIGVGSIGNAMYPVDDPLFGTRYVPMPIDLDEPMLKEIAMLTGGQYFRATDTQKLKEIYQAIGQMEKTKVEVKNYMKYTELAHYLVILAAVLLLLEILLNHTLFRKIP